MPPIRSEVEWRSYANGINAHTAWELLSESGNGPRIETFIAPYYPPELLEQKSSGKVVMDVDVTEIGDVAGVRLVSAEPDIFGTLATGAVRDWRFAPGAARIRVVVDFKPGN